MRNGEEERITKTKQLDVTNLSTGTICLKHRGTAPCCLDKYNAIKISALILIISVVSGVKQSAHSLVV